MKITVKGVVKYVLMLALAGVLLYFAFRGLKWHDFVDGLKTCDFRWIAASMVAGFLAILARGLRWRLMLLPINNKVKRIESYDAYSECYFANLALPRSGEIVRCALMAKTGKVPFDKAFGSMVLERTWDMIFAALIAVALVLFSRFGDFLVNQMWKPFVARLPFDAIWIIVILAAIIVSIWLVYKYNKEKIKKSRWGSKVAGFFHGIVVGVKSGFKMKHNVAFFAYTIFIWLCYWFESYFTIMAFPAISGLGMMDALFLMIVGSLGWLVPVQGGFGAYHLLVSMALVPIYGIPQSTGIIFATISHESQILVMILCGLISLISISFYKKKNKVTDETDS